MKYRIRRINWVGYYYVQYRPAWWPFWFLDENPHPIGGGIVLHITKKDARERVETLKIREIPDETVWP